jgi:hypothetical protein
MISPHGVLAQVAGFPGGGEAPLDARPSLLVLVVLSVVVIIDRGAEST